MKKVFVFSLLIAFVAGLSSCKNNDAPVLGATVKVKVENLLNIEKESITVYMFDKEVNNSTKKEDAKKQIVTDKNGIATFNLNFTELNIIESQTTLYFAVFYTAGDKDYVAGSKGITVERNKSYDVKIDIPV